MSATWKEQLQAKLANLFGIKKAAALTAKYANAFATSYIEEHPVDIAINDISHIENLSDDNRIETYFYFTDNAKYPLHLRIYQWNEPIPLSDVLPMLENLGLRAYDERPYRIKLSDQTSVWISDFSVVSSNQDVNIEKVKDLFNDAFKQIYLGTAENDGLNKLILCTFISWRDITILRAYTKYLRQVGFRFTQAYIEKALAANASITTDLLALFKARLTPPKCNPPKEKAETIEARLNQSLTAVVSLDEDRIYRRLMALIKATVRTNYFQSDAKGAPKKYLSFKFDSHQVPELPLPLPLYEIFVYSPRFEAIHLRADKVARGGIRWSDRLEDFRTEVLGLMKAQKVKNAIIVPSGAKGGFVLKTAAADRDGLKKEVTECYQSFIRGLLDITDNIRNNKVVPPNNVVCLDDADPYLVVAADKGTATFSDTANAISAEYHFWLGDAFASGGAKGYDHKKMGITARGAWESVKRHFREFDIDVMTTDISVVGIGDMSGDVFGNGMIYSKHIKLIASFDHRHIFVDPTPDPATSYLERLRLFNLPTSSWENYSAKLISKGGGVFSRQLKSITITPEMKRALGIDNDALTPTDLIRAILRAPVDLLFNGGIGTYVKSVVESNADVADRTNDDCRVNGGELRCRVVCEGGNLGFTQLGRIEYALNNGLINTDFIDNSAGVDCSDHEVNLKILLDREVNHGHLSEKKRDSILASLTDEIAELVLSDNYHQALVMSFSMYHAKKNATLHQSYLNDLEAAGVINREIEFLPSNKALLDRKSQGLGLSRPELAVMLAYSKIHIKSEILHSDLTDDPFLKNIVETAFPPSLRKTFASGMRDHRLHKEIIATQLSNHIVNEMGFTYVYRVQIETGANVSDIIRAFAVSTQLFGTFALQKSVQKLDFIIPMHDQYEMLFNIRQLLNLSTRWFLHTNYLKGKLSDLVTQFSSRVKTLEPVISTLMGGKTKLYLDSIVSSFEEKGLSKELAVRIGAYRAMYTSLNITDISMKYKFDLLTTARVYFAAGERFNLLWFRDHIASDSREGHWNILARLTLRDELDICQRALTIAVMQCCKKETDEKKLIDQWVVNNPHVSERWDNLLNLLHNSAQIEYTMFFIAIRELLGLIATSSQ